MSSAALEETLADLGWTVLMPQPVPAVDVEQRRNPRCLSVSGPLFGVLREALVCIDTHRVMLVGEMRDCTLTQFAEMVRTGIDPDDTPAAITRPVVASQRSLF